MREVVFYFTLLKLQNFYLVAGLARYYGITSDRRAAVHASGDGGRTRVVLEEEDGRASGHARPGRLRRGGRVPAVGVPRYDDIPAPGAVWYRQRRH